MKKKQILSPKKSLEQLVACGKQFYERRWMWGTAGNLSIRLRSEPLSIVITPSGLNNGHLTVRDLLTIHEDRPKAAYPRWLSPSSETAIHQAVYRAAPGVGAVFH